MQIRKIVHTISYPFTSAVDVVECTVTYDATNTLGARTVITHAGSSHSIWDAKPNWLRVYAHLDGFCANVEAQRIAQAAR